MSVSFFLFLVYSVLHISHIYSEREIEVGNWGVTACLSVRARLFKTNDVVS